MADFEDSTTPTWENVIDGQANLRDAVRRTITFEDKSNGKSYKLNENLLFSLCGRAGGIWKSGMCWSTTSRSRVAV